MTLQEILEIPSLIIGSDSITKREYLKEVSEQLRNYFPGLNIVAHDFLKSTGQARPVLKLHSGAWLYEEEILAAIKELTPVLIHDHGQYSGVRIIHPREHEIGLTTISTSLLWRNGKFSGTTGWSLNIHKNFRHLEFSKMFAHEDLQITWKRTHNFLFQGHL